MERRIRCMVAEGELGRAMRILQQAQIAPGTAETVAALRALHPEDSTPLTAAEAALPRDMPQLALSRTVFDQTVRTLPSFSGHGLDLTRFEHIRSLEQYCPAGHDAFYGLTCLILAGGASVSATLQRMLCAARVVAFAAWWGAATGRRVCVAARDGTRPGYAAASSVGRASPA